MKKLNILFLAVLVMFSFSAIKTYAQPKVTLNLTGGYGVPLGQFKLEVPTDRRTDADTFPYFTKQLINFGASGKLALGKKGNFRVVLGLNYNMFSNNTNGIFRKFSGDPNPSSIEFKPKVNVLSINLGGEWAFQPTKKVNPYVGVRAAANFFSGKFEFGQSVFVKGAQRTGPMDMKSETRIGFIFDAGIDFHLSPMVGAVIGLNYHMINPLGKGADDESEVGANEIDLGDAEHTEDGSTIGPRSISSFNGYVGISFYFGMPKTKSKK